MYGGKWKKINKIRHELQFPGNISQHLLNSALLCFVTSGRLGQLGLKEGFPTAVKNISSVIGMFIQHAQDEGKTVAFITLELFSLHVLRTWASPSNLNSCAFDLLRCVVSSRVSCSDEQFFLKKGNSAPGLVPCHSGSILRMAYHLSPMHVWAQNTCCLLG